MPTSRRPVRPVPTVANCKIRASHLLKDLRSDDSLRAEQAAEKFRVLPLFTADDVATILRGRAAIQRKHALAAIAASLGYANWAECRRRLEPPPAARLDTERFFTKAGGFLNRWFARYDEARASLVALGGTLFPFRWQFFICEAGFLDALGLDPGNPDWDRIGRDWLRPLDEAARQRLEMRLVALGYGGLNEPAPAPSR